MKSLTLSILLLILITDTVYISAQTLPIDKEVKLWAPPTMLVDEEYNIAIILTGYNDEERVFSVFSSNEDIVNVIDKEVIIEPFMNHGIVRVETRSIGKADLFVISGDELLKTSVAVVKRALTPAKLDVILPSNNVAIRQMPAYVYLLDSFGNPLRADENIEIDISTFGNVDAINRVIIERGMHYAKFTLDIDGDGGITVAANGLEPDTEEIEFTGTSDEIELKLAVAPDPLGPSSSGEVYVWLEKNGKPFIPSSDMKISLSSSDGRFLGFSKAIQQALPLEKDLFASTIITLKNGESFAHTTIWTADFAKNEISGSSESEISKDITISAVSSIDTDVVKSIDAASDTVTIKDFVIDEPDELKLFAYPDLAYDKFDIIPAFYKEGSPVRTTESRTLMINTDSLSKADVEVVRVAPDDLDLHDHYAVVHAITLGNVGETKVRVTAGGIDSAKDSANGEKERSEEEESSKDDVEAIVKIEEKYSEIPEIKITPLPAIAKSKQDLLLLYVTDGNILTDKKGKVTNLQIKTNPYIGTNNNYDTSSIVVIEGNVSDLVPEEGIKATAIAKGFRSTSETIKVFNPEVKRITAYNPDTVHANEPFPMIFYITDKNGRPIEKTTVSISPSGAVRNIGSLYATEMGDKYISNGNITSSDVNFVFFAEGISPATSKMQVFVNNIILDAKLDKSKVNQGDSLNLLYTVIPSDAKVMIKTDLMTERNANGFRISAGDAELGKHKIMLTATRDGFSSVTKEFNIDVTALPSTIIEKVDTTNKEIEESIEKVNANPLSVAKDSLDLLKNNMVQFMIVGVVIALAGGAFYTFKRKTRRQPSNDKELEF